MGELNHYALLDYQIEGETISGTLKKCIATENAGEKIFYERGCPQGVEK